MKTIAFYLQLVLLVFFLVFLVLFVFFDSLGAVVGMDQISPDAMAKIFLSGFILFLLAWAASSIGLTHVKSKLRKTEAELNSTKAKLYDMEHPKTSSSSKPIPQKNQDENSGMIRPRQNFTEQ